MLDVTEDSRAIVKTVRDICGVYECSSWNMNFTSLHIADIFAGSEKAKVRDSSKLVGKYSESDNTVLVLI